MLRYVASFTLVFCTAACAQEAQPPAPEKHDASNITHPSQADMLVGTRVPRSLVWSPPTNEERWRVWWRGIAASPGSYIRSTISAGIGHLGNTPADYGQGWGALGQRYGNTFVTYSLQDTAAQGLAAAAHYEMRYIQCKCTKVMPRIGHALLWNFVTYDEKGKTVFNWPSIGGGYAIGMLSTTYTPNQKWSAQGIQAGNSAIMFGFASSLLQEFTPSKLFARHRKHFVPASVPSAPSPVEPAKATAEDAATPAQSPVATAQIL